MCQGLEDPLTGNKWPGTKSGCIVSDSVKLGSCRNSKANTVSPITASYYYKLQNQTLCGIKSSDGYLDLVMGPRPISIQIL